MGRHDRHTVFLANTFPSSFTCDLAHITSFSTRIIDLETILCDLLSGNLIKRSDGFVNIDFLVLYITKLIEKYLVNPENNVSVSTVILMDSPGDTPKNKFINTGHEKRNNDGVGGDGDGDGDGDGSSCNGHSINSYKNQKHLDEKLFDELNSVFNYKENDYMFIKEGGYNYNLTGETIYSSVNLKLQLHRLIASRLIKLEPNKETILIIDGSSIFDTRDFSLDIRPDLIDINSFHSRSEFEKDCMVHSYISKELLLRHIVHDNKEVVHIPKLSTGDIPMKILEYIQFGNGAKSFVVVSRNMDYIFNLLLHFSVLVNKEGFDNDEFELYLDTRVNPSRSSSRSSSSKSKTRKKRKEVIGCGCINIKSLYYNIVKFFSNEYPGIKNPIETYVFLVSCLNTDYISPVNDYLCVSDSIIWNTFSELHHNNSNLETNGFVLFNDQPRYNDHDDGDDMYNNNDQIINRSKKKKFTSDLHGILNEAISYDDNLERLGFDIEKILVFMYFLYQQKLCRDLSIILERDKQTFLKKDLLSPIPVSDIYFFTHYIDEAINEFKKEELMITISEKEKLDCLYNNTVSRERSNDIRPEKKMVIPPHPPPPSPPPQLENITQRKTKNKRKKPEGENTFQDPSEKNYQKKFRFSSSLKRVQCGGDLNEKTILPQNTNTNTNSNRLFTDGDTNYDKMYSNKFYKRDRNDFLKTILREKIPLNYGIPEKKEVIARILRLQWYILYCFNGYKPCFSFEFCNDFSHETEMSLWGWEERDISDDETKRNNNIYSTYIVSNEEGVFLKMGETVETTNIFQSYEYINMLNT